MAVLTRLRGSAGMVTVETALVLPALFAVTALLLSLVGVVASKSSCAEAARSAARSAARGDDHRAVLAAARAAYPRVEDVAVDRRDDGTVEVVVSARPTALVVRLPLPEVSATVVAHDEAAAQS